MSGKRLLDADKIKQVRFIPGHEYKDKVKVSQVTGMITDIMRNIRLAIGRL